MVPQGFRIVHLFNIEEQLYGQIVIPPFDKPPMVLTWRGLAFLRMPKANLEIVRYREVSCYGIPDDQEIIDGEQSADCSQR